MLKRIPIGLVLPVLLLAGWELAAQLEVVSPFLLPPLSAVLGAIADMAGDGILWEHIGVSAARVLGGFVLGAALGVATGVFVGLSATAERVVDPTLQALRSIPSLAWAPLLLLWMGIDESPKVTLVAIGAYFPVYLSVVAGVRGVDRKLVEVGHIYGFSRSELIRRIILPAASPAVLTGLRTGLGVSWLFVVAAELIAAHSGLGFMLSDGRELGRADLVFSAIILLALCGKVTDGLLKRAESRLLAWRDTVVDGGGGARG